MVTEGVERGGPRAGTAEVLRTPDLAWCLPSQPDDSERVIDAVAVRQMLSVLSVTTARDARGALPLDDVPQADIARLYGITESRLCQVIAEARRRLAALVA